MKARRRFAGSESDDNFTLLVDTPEPEEDKKYAKKWNFRDFSLNTAQLIGGQLISSVVSPISTSFVEQQNQYSSLQNQSDNSVYDDFELPETELVIMASRDRTNEFATAVRSLQSRNIQRAVNIKDPRKARQLQSYSEFMMIARNIGRNIASTYTKLEKLALCEHFFRPLFTFQT